LGEHFGERFAWVLDLIAVALLLPPVPELSGAGDVFAPCPDCAVVGYALVGVLLAFDDVITAPAAAVQPVSGAAFVVSEQGAHGRASVS
jgi:hypothetical protein